jgi:hypothetical protein
MRHLFSLLFSLAWLSLLFPSCEDFVERGIEGQWQMTKIVNVDGSEQLVDTIYYQFRKGVFKYLRMETDLDPFYAFGLYSEHGSKLDLRVTDWLDCNGDCLYWNGMQERTYDVKRKTSSALELEFEGERYVFRKY